MAAEYKETCEALALHLERVALAVELGAPLPELRVTREIELQPAAVGRSRWTYARTGAPYGVLDVETYLGPSARFKLTVRDPSPAAIRQRAADLRKTGRTTDYGVGNWPRHIPKPTTSRPPYSDAIYRRFLDDDEPENAQAYKDLYK